MINRGRERVITAATTAPFNWKTYTQELVKKTKPLKPTPEEEDAISKGQMRPRPTDLAWTNVRDQIRERFGYSDQDMIKYDTMTKEDMLGAYEVMQLCRIFENSCNQAYMQGKIRGFMHLDNGQETIPAMVADTIRQGDKKHSYYREHTHALASGVDAKKIMAELFMKVDGTCKGAGGSMHIYDVENNFQVSKFEYNHRSDFFFLERCVVPFIVKIS